MIGTLRVVSQGLGQAPVACRLNCQNTRSARILLLNKTRQGYARERILKPAGYFFVRPELAPLKRLEGAR